MNEADKLKFKEEMDNLGKKADEKKAAAKAKSLRKKELAAAAEEAAKQKELDVITKAQDAKRLKVMGVPVSEPEEPTPKPTISDADLVKKLDTNKADKEAKKEAEVAAAAERAIAASKKQDAAAKDACKDCPTKDEHWTANMPQAMQNIELDIASENQVNYAMDQYRVAHMF